MLLGLLIKASKYGLVRGSPIADRKPFIVDHSQQAGQVIADSRESLPGGLASSHCR